MSVKIDEQNSEHDQIISIDSYGIQEKFSKSDTIKLRNKHIG